MRWPIEGVVTAYDEATGTLTARFGDTDMSAVAIGPILRPLVTADMFVGKKITYEAEIRFG